MTLWPRLFNSRSTASGNVPRRQLNQDGWERYARAWDSMRKKNAIPDLSSTRATEVEHLGDEWSFMEDASFAYGIEFKTIAEFEEYLEHRLLAPYLPEGERLRIMEIGPGGGRVTSLLLRRARELYAVDISGAMLQKLQARFRGDERIIPVVTDGTAISGVPQQGIDAFVSFDAFVHIEPWEIFRYLEIVQTLLRPGGVGIVHFSDVETSIGFGLFKSQVPSVVKNGIDFATFSVMTKGIMERFLTDLGFKILSNTNSVLPRDAVAVFRRPA